MVNFIVLKGAKKYMKNTVILISSKMRGGKTTLANGLVKNYGGITFNMGDYVREEAKRLGLKATRTNLQNLGQQLMDSDMLYFCQLCLNPVQSDLDNLLVIAGIRKEAQISCFKKLLPEKNFIHLHISLSEDQHLQRIIKENEDVASLMHSTEAEINRLEEISNIQINGDAAIEVMIKTAIHKIDTYVSKTGEKNSFVTDFLNDYCTFCQKETDRIIYQSTNFTVWLTLGQMIEGYCLIIPKEHYPSISSVPEHLWDELEYVKKNVKAALTDMYGCCQFYEHGRIGQCNVAPGEQLCYHAHLHAVPILENLYDEFDDDLLKIKLNSFSDVYEKHNEYGHYLYYEDSDGVANIYLVTKPIRRQYLRWLVAKKIGDEALADWSKYPGWINIFNAKAKLINYDWSKIDE